MTPTIFKFMDCSTVHITKEDKNLLEIDSLPGRAGSVGRPIIVYSYPEGFFVHIGPLLSEDKPEHLKHGYSNDLLDLMEIAAKAECYFLRLDADGEMYDALPKHEWE